ncbi:MAG: DUF5412 domain-containing protein [Candidatus Doudnabacteria bacterium]|nr:DUF5412 domain-containing protein [Candidatus Doudnabacteria bacterium]
MSNIQTGQTLTSTELALINALNALATSGAQQAIQKTGAASFANVDVGSGSAVLSDGHIFVGSSSNVAADVALTLSGTAGTFALANTGILTMPDASSSSRGLLNSSDWTTFNAKESALTFSTGLTRSSNTVTANLSTGIAGGQSAIGGTAASESLTLSSTTHGTKGTIIMGTSSYSEVTNALTLKGAVAGGAAAANLYLYSTTSNGASTVTFLNSAGTSKASIFYENTTGGFFPDQFVFYTHAAIPMIFAPNGSEKLRISSTGVLTSTASATGATATTYSFTPSLTNTNGGDVLKAFSITPTFTLAFSTATTYGIYYSDTLTISGGSSTTNYGAYIFSQNNNAGAGTGYAVYAETASNASGTAATMYAGYFKANDSAFGGTSRTRIGLWATTGGYGANGTLAYGVAGEVTTQVTGTGVSAALYGNSKLVTPATPTINYTLLLQANSVTTLSQDWNGSTIINVAASTSSAFDLQIGGNSIDKVLGTYAHWYNLGANSVPATTRAAFNYVANSTTAITGLTMLVGNGQYSINGSTSTAYASTQRIGLISTASIARVTLSDSVDIVRFNAVADAIIGMIGAVGTNASGEALGVYGSVGLNADPTSALASMTGVAGKISVPTNTTVAGWTTTTIKLAAIQGILDLRNVSSASVNTVGGAGVTGTALGITNMTIYGGWFSATGGSVNYGVYSAAGTNYFAGAVGLNALTPSAQLHVIQTTEQLRVGYDTSNYYSTTVGSTGGVTFDAVGSGAGFTFSDSVTLADAKDFAVGTGTGTKIATATSQKIGFWNTAPIVQPTTAVGAATLVGGGGATITDTDTFDGYTLQQIVKALRNAGLLA